ncbi:MAG: OsmC family protein [Alphaproteobacteria bacterium]|nr:OsmC family protein [Alphaproteobacteria bacterium]
MTKMHSYEATTTWTGANDEGTRTYNSYTRDYTVAVSGKADILGSSDPAFRGDPTRHNPEDMLVASVSSCHMLWYLHLCAVNGVVVTSYEDTALGEMSEGEGGAGKFERITLRPRITITAESDMEKAMTLHHEANEKCFVANSLNCPVDHEPDITVG